MFPDKEIVQFFKCGFQYGGKQLDWGIFKTQKLKSFSDTLNAVSRN